MDALPKKSKRSHPAGIFDGAASVARHHHRPALHGDCFRLLVEALRRLATQLPFDHLFAIVKQIVDAKAQFRLLAEPWAVRRREEAFRAGQSNRHCQENDLLDRIGSA